MNSKVTIQLPVELIGELKNAIVYLQSKGRDETLSGQIKMAIERHMNLMRDAYMGGRPFPKRKKQLRTGRRIKL